MDDRIKKEICSLGNVKRLPTRLHIEEHENCIKVILNGNKLQDSNMQESGNDFEGWVFAARVCEQRLKIEKPIVLDVEEGTLFQYDGSTKNGHLCRFLYRAMKFSEQYKDWFGLSDYLKGQVDKFRNYLIENNGKLYNNIGNDAAGDKNKYLDENAIEGKLAEKGVLAKVLDPEDIGGGKVHRQLPVGLFVNEVKKENAIFTGGKSAIDLWTRNNNELIVVELKTKNIMMGIITEIFFYCNYMLDLVREDGLFTLNDKMKPNKDHRGYEELLEKGINKVTGFMLADDQNFHPWVNDDCIEIMNANNKEELRYIKKSYHYDVVISKA